jgi:hypothetical protein
MLKHFVGPFVQRANFGEVDPVQTYPDEGNTNERTMKKALLVLAVVVAGSFVLASCNSSHSCPAYGKVTKVPAEKAV